MNIVNNYVEKATTMSDFVTKLTKYIYPDLKVKTAMEMYVNLDNFKLLAKEYAKKSLNKKRKSFQIYRDYITFWHLHRWQEYIKSRIE